MYGKGSQDQLDGCANDVSCDFATEKGVSPPWFGTVSGYGFGTPGGAATCILSQIGGVVRTGKASHTREPVRENYVNTYERQTH